MVGDYIFTDSEFINRLSVENRNLFEKIYGSDVVFPVRQDLQTEEDAQDPYDDLPFDMPENLEEGQLSDRHSNKPPWTPRRFLRCYRIRQIRPVAPSLTILVSVPRNRERTSSGVRISLAVRPSWISS